VRKAFYIGIITGFILGVAVALSMDLLLGKSLGGGWTEAVANDLNHLFNSNLSTSHLLVIIGVVIVIGIIGAFGSLIGGVSFVMIAYLFKSLTKER
jgi:Fe2+ transport system protein B